MVLDRVLCIVMCSILCLALVFSLGVVFSKKYKELMWLCNYCQVVLLLSAFVNAVAIMYMYMNKRALYIFSYFNFKCSNIGGIICVACAVIFVLFYNKRIKKRKCEMCARFILDTMPGRKMSIAADCSSGIICKEEATNRRSELENKAKLCERIDQINYINTINVTINIICITLLIVLCVYLNKQGNILWMDFSNIIIAYSIIALSPTLIMEIALTVGSIEKYIK